MTINTRVTLLAACATYSKRTDLTAEWPDYLTLAEDRIAQWVRVRAQESQARLIVKAETNVTSVGGAANAITLSPTTAVTSYAIGDAYSFTAIATNTGATTLLVSLLAAQSVKQSFSGTKAALSGGEIISGASYRVYHDGTDFLLSPASAVLLPTDFLEFRSDYVSSNSKLIQFTDAQNLWSRLVTNEVGSPRFAAIEGDWLCIAPKADSTYFIPIDYYRRFAALTADNDTNWLLTSARGIYLFACLLEAAQAKKDFQAALGWSTRFDEAVEAVNRNDKRARYAPGTAVRSEVPCT